MATITSDLVSLFTPEKPALIVTHQFPDVDAIGSTLALYLQLKQRNIPVKIWSSDYNVNDFKFLPSCSEILTEHPKNFSYSTLFVLDCSSLQRVKDHALLTIKESTTVVNIDHHVDNSKFGKLNYVKDISSVGEYLTTLFQELNWDISEEVATCLYAAIAFDTGRFLYSNTTADTFSTISYLLNCGARSFDTNIAMYEDVSLNTFNYIKTGLENLFINKELGYCYTYLPKDSPKVNYKMIDFIRQLGKIDVFLVFSELENNVIKISLRSKQFFDVSSFSHQFGGGGHARAAGITLTGKLPDVKDKVCKALEKSLKS